jgi:hypothetical protein
MLELTKQALLSRILGSPLRLRKATRFRRNQLKNLARRKGYRLLRVYTRHIGWIYRIEILPYPGNGEKLIRTYDYCKTQAATAAERLALHLLGKPDISWKRKKKLVSL